LAGILPGLFKVYEVRIQGVTEKEICRRITDRLSGMAVDICTELNRWALEQPEEQTMLAPDPDGKEEAEELVEDLPF
jgi:ribosome maturation factor RimP